MNYHEGTRTPIPVHFLALIAVATVACSLPRRVFAKKLDMVITQEELAENNQRN